MNPYSGECALTGPGPSGPGPINPIDPGPINPINPNPNPITGGDWSAECKMLHSQVFGNRPVSCPADHYKDSNTCGCNPNSTPNVCAMCGTNTCGPNHECANPTGGTAASPGICSFVCLGNTDTVSVAFKTARAITLSRFNSANGLNHYGAIICDIYPNATDLTIHDSLKDPLCKRMYRALSHASSNGVVVPETVDKLGSLYNIVIKDVSDLKLIPVKSGTINGTSP